MRNVHYVAYCDRLSRSMVCQSVTRLSCAKTAKRIEVLFEVKTLVDQGTLYYMGARRFDATFAKLLRPFVIILHTHLTASNWSRCKRVVIPRSSASAVGTRMETACIRHEAYTSACDVLSATHCYSSIIIRLRRRSALLGIGTFSSAANRAAVLPAINDVQNFMTSSAATATRVAREIYPRGGPCHLPDAQF